MRTDAFIEAVCKNQKGERLEEFRKGLPIGKDENGEIVIAQKREKPLSVRNTCVTGAGRTEFIRQMVIVLSCLFEKEEASFFVLSPYTEYGELLRLNSLDVTVPYIRSQEDIKSAKETLTELVRIRSMGAGHPRLFIVLDGLDELPDVKEGGELEEYRSINELLMRKKDVDIITGVDLSKSIFSGYPGAFLGVGNCLITTREKGEADVTYVGEDSSLTLPIPIIYPSEPNVLDVISYLNNIPARE